MRTKQQNSTRQQNPVDWLFPEVRKRVLSLLLSDPDERVYLRDIARRTGCAPAAVQREIKGLTAAEILLRVKDGNRVYYQANISCPLLSDLIGMIRKTSGLIDVIKASLETFTEQIDLAFIYGSQAAGEASATSDVDLLIVGDVDEISLVKSIAKAEERLARPVNYILMDRAEFSGHRKKTGEFLSRVLESEKIIIMGDPDEIR